MSDQDKSKSLFDGVVEGDKPKDQSEESPLKVLVGKGRKYSTEEELAKGYLNADEHISTLEDENRKLKEQVASGRTLDDVLEKIEANRKRQGDDTPVTPKGVSAEDIAKIVEQTLTGRETAREQSANLATVEAEMNKRFGEKAGEMFKSVATTPAKAAALKNLAAADPKAFMQLFAEKPYQGNAADGGNNRGDAGSLNEQKRQSNLDPDTKAYYDEMRRKEPKKYYSQAVQLEIHKKAQANPEKFLGRSL